MKHSGGTFSGKRLLLCIDKFWVVGYCCTREGRIVDDSRIVAIKDWTVCLDKSDVHSFLGTVGAILGILPIEHII